MMLGEQQGMGMDSGWGGLFSTALNIGAQIYQGQLQKKATKAAIKAGTSDFPQLGLGLAASGPQRGVMQPLSSNYYGGNAMAGGVVSGGSSTASGVMVGAPRPQYIVYQTMNGNQVVTGVRSLGRPMLWSGDLAAVKRVARVARKLGRFVRHRSPR